MAQIVFRIRTYFLSTFFVSSLIGYIFVDLRATMTKKILRHRDLNIFKVLSCHFEDAIIFVDDAESQSL